MGLSPISSSPESNSGLGIHGLSPCKFSAPLSSQEKRPSSPDRSEGYSLGVRIRIELEAKVPRLKHYLSSLAPGFY